MTQQSPPQQQRQQRPYSGIRSSNSGSNSASGCKSDSSNTSDRSCRGSNSSSSPDRTSRNTTDTGLTNPNKTVEPNPTHPRAAARCGTVIRTPPVDLLDSPLHHCQRYIMRDIMQICINKHDSEYPLFTGFVSDYVAQQLWH